MRWIAGWLIILIVSGCTDNKKVPPGVIEQPRMEKILWDMMQADRYVAAFIVPDRKDDSALKKRKGSGIIRTGIPVK